jgi:hypothetical protein
MGVRTLDLELWSREGRKVQVERRDTGCWSRNQGRSRWALPNASDDLIALPAASVPAFVSRQSCSSSNADNNGGVCGGGADVLSQGGGEGVRDVSKSDAPNAHDGQQGARWCSELLLESRLVQIRASGDETLPLLPLKLR